MTGIYVGGRLGTLHFIRFPTSQMNAFIALAKEKGMADLASTVCATGGGAYKFEPDFKREVNMNLNKFDELDSLIRGVEFIVENSNKSYFTIKELFYYDEPQNEVSGNIETPFDQASSSIYP